VSFSFATPVARGLTYVTIAAVAWGTGGVVAAVLYRTSGLGPVAVSFWRTAIGAALLVAVHLWRRPASRSGGRRRPVVALVTGAGLAVYQTAYYAAVAHSGVAFATLATLGAGPILIAVGARLTIGERLGRYGTAAVLAAPAGLLLISLGASACRAPVGECASRGASVAGLVFSLISATGYAVVTVLHRGLGGVDPSRTTRTGFLVAAVLLAPLALLEGLWPTRGTPLVTLGALGYLGAVSTAMAYSLFFASLGAIRATTVSVVTLAEPLTASVSAVLVLGERLTWQLGLGAAVLLGAVLLLARAESRPAHDIPRDRRPQDPADHEAIVMIAPIMDP
jgi:DME family drug/metabolite transporter